MFSDSFTKIEHGDAAAIVDQINLLLDGAPFDPSIVRVLSHALPFYPNYNLVEITDYDENPFRRISFVQQRKEDNGQIYILNGTNEPIYHFGEVFFVLLGGENIKLYIQFFFSYVRGHYSRFLIIENPDEINWKEEPALNARQALGKMISPIELIKILGDGTYNLKASIIFKDSLFESEISVSKTGQVNLNNQELVVEDIPVLDDSFAQ